MQRSEGSTARSSGFRQREETEETRYVREKERETLKALREKVAAQKKALDELERDVDMFTNQREEKK